MATDKPRERGHEIGATGRTVAANVARIRKSQQISLQQLEDRLAELGRRISFSGLSKIERAQKRVEVDDLMALAIALDVSPVSLLLPVDTPVTNVEVTGARGALGLFWTWALAGRTPFGPDDRAFVARSIPWWLDVQPDVQWYGDTELAIATGVDEPEVVEKHVYTAKSPAEAGWDRNPDGEHQAAE